MKKFALIGTGIAHSKSPELFKLAGYDTSLFSYNLIESSNLARALAFFENEGYIGANVTAPFKEEILKYCTHLHPSAKESDAANLIVKRGSSLEAYNTDTSGTIEPLLSRGVTSGRVLLVGAGGAARASAYILNKNGFEVTIVNRTLEKAKQLSQRYNCDYIKVEEVPSNISNFDILVYTLPTTLEQIKADMVADLMVLEPNYKNPTFNREQCREYICGIEWLIHQAIPGLKTFTGIEPDTKAMFNLKDNC